ncbi:hypothetical protein NDU88_005952 [Pleurodeles waltl]|uniref:Uncharacterized protein n=1 Tax=Pleurodeles waltl TaxID=8319 RepID=A0AAV7W988_PLEWA|nr:hypothetical protein NDU88_005952 [Pleurodeles waltl]
MFQIIGRRIVDKLLRESFLKFKDAPMLTSLPSVFIINGTPISVNSTICPKELFPKDAFTSTCLFFIILLVVLPVTGTIYVEIITRKEKDAVTPAISSPSPSNYYGSISSMRNDNSNTKVEIQSTSTSQFSTDLHDGNKKRTSRSCERKRLNIRELAVEPVLSGVAGR